MLTSYHQGQRAVRLRGQRRSTRDQPYLRPRNTKSRRVLRFSATAAIFNSCPLCITGTRPSHNLGRGSQYRSRKSARQAFRDRRILTCFQFASPIEFNSALRVTVNFETPTVQVFGTRTRQIAVKKSITAGTIGTILCSSAMSGTTERDVT